MALRLKKVIGALVLVLVAASLVVMFLVGRSPGGGGGMGGAAGVWLSGRRVAGVASPVVAVVRIEGEIRSGLSAETLTASLAGSDAVVGYLDEALSDPSVCAVVLRLNSPGGSAAAAQEIAGAVWRLRDAGKVTVASMGDVAASGAYWVSSACHEVFANPGTLTGSIGVIMEVQSLEELYRKLGIGVTTFKSGPYKDMGSSTRPVTPDESSLLQAMIDDVYTQFVDTVTVNRHLPREAVLDLADGRVFTGRQALQADLVDHLGGLQDAEDRAAEMAGIEGAYTVREIGSVSAFERLLRWLGTRTPALASADGGWGPLGILRRLLLLPWPGVQDAIP